MSLCAGLAADRVFAPVERELVFDIDLTDYDDVRTCGKEGHICNACWPLMAVAVEVKTSAPCRTHRLCSHDLIAGCYAALKGTPPCQCGAAP